MTSYRLESDDDRVRISLTGWGRFRSAAWAFVVASVVAVVIMSMLYLPDWVGDYSNRERAFQGFFLVYFLGAALLVGVIAGVMKGLADSRWELDSGRGVATWWTRTGFGREYDDQLDIELIERFELRGRTWFLGVHELLVILEDGSSATIASSRFGAEELRSLQRACNQALDG